MVVNGKIVDIYVTTNALEKYQNILSTLINVTEILIRHYPYDMLIFKTNENDEWIVVSVDGYELRNGTYLNEQIARYPNSLHFKDKLWFKIDDYGNKYLGTYLLPEDY